jgi:hypothetical protein
VDSQTEAYLTSAALNVINLRGGDGTDRASLQFIIFYQKSVINVRKRGIEILGSINKSFFQSLAVIQNQ